MERPPSMKTDSDHKTFYRNLNTTSQNNLDLVKQLHYLLEQQRIKKLFLDSEDKIRKQQVEEEKKK